MDCQHLDIISHNDTQLAEAIIDRIWRHKIDESDLYLRGNWYDLLMTLTEGSFDLTDALFMSLGRGRRPGTVHMFLSQLVNFLGVRLFLTLNFDPFLETALRESGHNPIVYDTSRDAKLPSALIVRQYLSVLKLHGGFHGVRIGERIQESLDPETRDRALEIIPPNALVVVLGFSGYERRMMQLLETVVRRSQRDDVALLWMHWETRVDQPVRLLEERLAQDKLAHRVQTRQLDDVASFLLDLLCSHCGAYPASERPYAALPTRPPASGDRLAPLPSARVHVFPTSSIKRFHHRWYENPTLDPQHERW